MRRPSVEASAAPPPCRCRPGSLSAGRRRCRRARRRPGWRRCRPSWRRRAGVAGGHRVGGVRPWWAGLVDHGVDSLRRISLLGHFRPPRHARTRTRDVESDVPGCHRATDLARADSRSRPWRISPRCWGCPSRCDWPSRSRLAFGVVGGDVLAGALGSAPWSARVVGVLLGVFDGFGVVLPVGVGVGVGRQRRRGRGRRLGGLRGRRRGRRLGGLRGRRRRLRGRDGRGRGVTTGARHRADHPGGGVQPGPADRPRS